MKTIDEMIEIMQAFADGKCIETQQRDGSWIVKEKINWNWGLMDYRIGPESTQPSNDEGTKQKTDIEKACRN